MFRGPRGHQPRNRQLGVTEPPQEHVLLAALQVNVGDPESAHVAVERLREVVRLELQGDLAEPATETGELGYPSGDYEDGQLTVTVGFSTDGYDKLAAPVERRPVDLQPIPPDMLDSSGQAQGAEVAGEGDVLLKIASNDIYVVEHVLRRVEHELSDVITVAWTQTGARRYNSRQGRNLRNEDRALNGFLDGTANLNPADPEHRALIFTDHARTDYPQLPVPDQYGGNVRFPADLRPPPATPEPADLDGGTYMAVEVQLIRTAEWDQQPMEEQERSVGRQKLSGEVLPTTDPASHVLKSNPGRPEDAPRRYLRRGYPLIRPYGATLGRGLIFIAFGRTLSTQVEFGRRAWINNLDFPTIGAGKDLLLDRFVQPRLLCGGYYFVPPLLRVTQPWSWAV